jgi:hypothetical protein
MNKCEWIETKARCNCCDKWREYLNKQLEILETMWEKKHDL